VLSLAIHTQRQTSQWIYLNTVFFPPGIAKKKTIQKRYTALFDEIIPDNIAEEIRHSINQVWALGDEGFKQQIEK